MCCVPLSRARRGGEEEGEWEREREREVNLLDVNGHGVLEE